MNKHMVVMRARSRAQSSTPRMQRSTHSISVNAPRIYCMHHTLQTPRPCTQMHHIIPHLHHATHTLHVRPTPHHHHTHTAHAPLHHTWHTPHLHHSACDTTPHLTTQRPPHNPHHTNAHHTYAHNTTLDHTAPENHRAHGDCRSMTRIRRRADQAHSP